MTTLISGKSLPEIKLKRFRKREHNESNEREDCHHYNTV
jgi:hypothetical protein